jgi:hypothetical protein
MLQSLTGWVLLMCWSGIVRAFWAVVSTDVWRTDPFRGSGYRAVPIQQLEQRRLHDLCPELQGEYREDSAWFQFGRGYRGTTSEGSGALIKAQRAEIAESIALCFDSLFPPVFTALLCLEPRCANDNHVEFHFGDENLILNVRNIIETRATPNFKPDSRDWSPWFRHGIVFTQIFPNVQQWIALFRTIMAHAPVERTK